MEALRLAPKRKRGASVPLVDRAAAKNFWAPVLNHGGLVLPLFSPRGGVARAPRWGPVEGGRRTGVWCLYPCCSTGGYGHAHDGFRPAVAFFDRLRSLLRPRRKLGPRERG